MGDLVTDIGLALVIIFFLFLTKWAIDFTGSKAIGVILAVILGYLTFFQHFELIPVFLVLFFMFPFFSKLIEGFEG